MSRAGSQGRRCEQPVRHGPRQARRSRRVASTRSTPSSRRPASASASTTRSRSSRPTAPRSSTPTAGPAVTRRRRTAAVPTAPATWQVTTVATRGAANACSPIRVNEIRSDPNPDWVELVNLSGAPVDVTGWVVKDSTDTDPTTLSGSVPARRPPGRRRPRCRARRCRLGAPVRPHAEADRLLRRGPRTACRPTPAARTGSAPSPPAPPPPPARSTTVPAWRPSRGSARRTSRRPTWPRRSTRTRAAWSSTRPTRPATPCGSRRTRPARSGR